MKRQSAILESAYPVPPFWEVRLGMTHVPMAGAYVLADLGGPTRVPLFPSRTDTTGMTTVVAPTHPLAHVLPGTVIDVLGPLGRGYRLAPGGRSIGRLLLVAEVDMLPFVSPLYEAAPSVALVVEAPTWARLPQPARFPPTLELTLVTLDGSGGYAGPLEGAVATSSEVVLAAAKLRELLTWAECVCFACDRARYPGLACLVREVRLQTYPDFAQALVKVPMPCGVGACDVCRVATRRGERHACVDGPVFDLLDFLPM